MRALADPKNRAVMDKTTAALARQMQRDFHAGLRSPHAQVLGTHRNAGFFRLVGVPGPEGLARINRHFEEIAEILWRSAGKKGELVALAWMMAPVDRKPT
jgi:hypothetical protein